MNEVLKVVLSMSLSGGIVILLLLLLSALFGKKLSRQWQYYIWLIAMLRLLLPFAPQQNLMNLLFQTAESAISDAGYRTEDREGNGLTRMSEDQPADGQVQDLENKKGKTEGWTVAGQMSAESGISENQISATSVDLFFVYQNIWLLWMIPALYLFIRKGIRFVGLLKWLRAGSDTVQECAMLEHFDRLLEKSRVRHKVSLSVNGMASSPMLIGFFRPCIILPSAEFSALEFEHTVLHELVHYKRGDILYKWLVQLTVCVHWFNPLVYVLQRHMNRACELSCDEAVLRKLDTDGRYAYGDTLLRAAGRRGKDSNVMSFLTFSDNKEQLKERLDAIMNFQKKTKGTRIITIALTVLLCVGTVYTGVYAEEKEDAAANPVSGLKTTPAASAQAKHSVIYEAGEYFILFDGATEKDLPGSTGPDFGVTFGAVWPDAYVSFDSYHVNKNLVKKMKKECSYWRGKGWLTKKEANAILAVAAKVQKGDTGSFKISRQEREYAQWGITKRNGFYYYKNQRIRVIMDIRAFHARSSFHNFYYHAKGSIDLKIIRGNHNKIKKVVFLSKERADAILSDMGVKR